MTVHDVRRVLRSHPRLATTTRVHAPRPLTGRRTATRHTTIAIIPNSNAAFPTSNAAFRNSNIAYWIRSAVTRARIVATSSRLTAIRFLIVATPARLAVTRTRGAAFLVRCAATPSQDTTFRTTGAASPAGGGSAPTAESASESSDDIPQTQARPPPSANETLATLVPPRGWDANRYNEKGCDSTMPTFPERESDIARLAHDLASGLAAHPEEFPAPPVAAEELEQSLTAYNDAREAAIESSADAQQGTAAKNQALGGLVDKMKRNLRYAENIARGENGKLQLLGWAAPRRGTSRDAPGQARTLEVIREGADWVFLDWKEPVDGGKVTAYRIQRRMRDGGAWIDVGMAVESEVLLNGQEAGVEFEYHVIAVNKAGEGRPSNIVRAVL